MSRDTKNLTYFSTAHDSIFIRMSLPQIKLQNNNDSSKKHIINKLTNQQNRTATLTKTKQT